MGFAHVAAGFGPFCDDGRGAQLLHLQGIGHRCDDGNHVDAGCFPCIHVRSGRTGAGRNHFDAFFDDHGGDVGCIRCGEHDVHAEGFTGQFAGFADLCADRVGTAEDGGNQSQAAGLGDGGGETGVGNPGHTALEEGFFDPQDMGNCSFHFSLQS